MINTFNCGVGFCLIVKRNNVSKIKRYFTKKYTPYEIGYISKDKKDLTYKKYQMVKEILVFSFLAQVQI